MKAAAAGLLAIAGLCLTLPVRSEAAEEASDGRHRIGLSVQLVPAGHSTGMKEYLWDVDYTLSPGFSAHYGYKISTALEIGAELQRRFVRGDYWKWYATEERYMGTIDWDWASVGSWDVFLSAGLGLSAFWTLETDYNYAGIGPGVSLSTGVRRWFGNVAVAGELGAEVDLRWGVGPMDSSNGAITATWLVFGSLGIEVAL